MIFWIERFGEGWRKEEDGRKWKVLKSRDQVEALGRCGGIGLENRKGF